MTAKRGKSLLLFVYGSLKRGERNHGVIAAQEFLRAAVTEPRYQLYDRGPYPCLVVAPAEGQAVHGEAWRIDESTLRTLDELEDVPRLFNRCPIALANFSRMVWAYFYQHDVRALADCGSCWTGARRLTPNRA